ncbi:MAG TPA: PadR family transcriptional regulator [Vicinamibacterales bacterium]
MASKSEAAGKPAPRPRGSDTPGVPPPRSGLHNELKRGSAELLILALLEERRRHGYEIGQLIARRSDGAINFHITSLYPTLYRLEDRGLIDGRWVERAGQRRRRYYRLTPAGRRTLASQRNVWESFFAALNRVARITET